MCIETSKQEPKSKLGELLVEASPKNEINLWASLQKFKNKNFVLISNALQTEGPLDIKDLRRETGLPDDKLISTIKEMEHANLIIYDSKTKLFNLTNLGSVLLVSLKLIGEEHKNKLPTI